MEPGTRDTRIAHVVRIVRKYRLEGLRCLGAVCLSVLFIYMIFSPLGGEDDAFERTTGPLRVGHNERPAGKEIPAK